MNLPTLHGRAAWIFTEDDYDIDLIVGIKNIKITDINELAAVTMTSYDPDFAKSVNKGDLLVGGQNFGYGHPHYPAMRAMRLSSQLPPCFATQPARRSTRPGWSSAITVSTR